MAKSVSNLYKSQAKTRRQIWDNTLIQNPRSSRIDPRVTPFYIFRAGISCIARCLKRTGKKSTTNGSRDPGVSFERKCDKTISKLR